MVDSAELLDALMQPAQAGPDDRHFTLFGHLPGHLLDVNDQVSQLAGLKVQHFDQLIEDGREFIAVAHGSLSRRMQHIPYDLFPRSKQRTVSQGEALAHYNYYPDLLFYLPDQIGLIEE
jgi:hypothetical protein